MRRRFEVQLRLGQTPIEKVIIPLHSRDELPPILAGLQWIFMTLEVNTQVFELLESKLGKKLPTGRPGMALWQILVFGIVRLGLDLNYDRLADLGNYHYLLRQILGVSPILAADEPPFNYKTLSQNASLVDEELLAAINAIVVQAGRPVFKKKGRVEPIRAKADSYVLETNVHYPTDVNLLWDAQRKCADLLEPLVKAYQVSGWRKLKYWRTRLKGQMLGLTRLLSGGGTNKEQRARAAAEAYLKDSYCFEDKVFRALRQLPPPADLLEMLKREQVDYFDTMMIKQMDLVERRCLRGEKIAHAEKIFSLFEPHTEMIKKGKLFPPIEFGHKLLVTTDQHELILDYRVMEQPNDADEAIPLVDRLLSQYGVGNIASLSFDKGFSREEDRALLELYIPQVIIPKRGKRNAREQERESARSFVALRRKHHGVESDINCLEYHGLNRCLDKGWHGFKRYVGFGVLAYNLHKIGARLLAQRRQQSTSVKGLGERRKLAA